MLIVKRRHDQVLKIGPDVEIKIVAIERGAVTLGVIAPPSFRISREPTQSDGADTNGQPASR